MAEDEGEEDLPLNEHDDVTHWIGKLGNDNTQKPSADRQTHSKPSEGEG